MRRIVKDHGLALTMVGIFFASLIGLVFAGWSAYNADQSDHGQPQVGLGEYLVSPNFGEAVFENWESEFLQMGGYVVLTVFLFQRGSAESKDPDKGDKVDEDPNRERHKKDAPWPVRMGGLPLIVYENSLAIALLALFAISFALHALTGAAEYSQEQLLHGGQPVTAIDYIFTAQFWFESFQNWQSEFLAVGTLIVLSIFLRQRGSPQSKPVTAPHAQTGE